MRNDIMTAAEKVRGVLDKFTDKKRGSLIPMLQELQEANGYLTRDMLIQVGGRLGIPVSKVYGVASFYNQFRFQAPGLYKIQVCRGTACHVKGSLGVLEAIKRDLKIDAGQTTRDGLFSIEVVSCVGACGLAPVICINGEFFAGVTPESVVEILATFRRKAANNE
jgi:NADH:ubiquinone oxidoreductase subunit E